MHRRVGAAIDIPDDDEVTSARYRDERAVRVKSHWLFGTLSNKSEEAAYLASAWNERRKIGLAVSSIILLSLLFFGLAMVFSPTEVPSMLQPFALLVGGAVSVFIAIWCFISDRPGRILDAAMFLPCVTLSAFLFNGTRYGMPWEIVPGIIMISMFIYGVFLPHRPPVAAATLGLLFSVYLAMGILGGFFTEPFSVMMAAGVGIACMAMVRSTAISRREKFLQQAQLEGLAEQLDRNLQDLGLENRAVERAAAENAALADELALSRMAAEENSTLLELLLDTMTQGVICYGTDLTVIKCNRRFAEFMRIPDEFTKPGTHIAKIFERSLAEGIFGSPEERDMALERVRVYARSGDFNPVVVERETAPGLFIELRTMPFPSGGVVTTVTNISERKVAEQHMRHKALHDSLTGLANRELFKDRIEAAIARSKRIGHYAALAMIDLDEFKPVNDTFGHPAGDALLQEIAKLIKETVREIDTVARLGGDEFAIVFDGIGVLKDVSAPIGRIFDRLQSPITVHGCEITVGASMGVAFYPLDAENSESLERAADAALLKAKRAGRNRYYYSQQNYLSGLPSVAEG